MTSKLLKFLKPVAKTVTVAGIAKLAYESFKKFGFITYVFEEEDPVFPSLYSWLVNNKSILPLASKLVIDKAEGVVNFNENYEGLGTHSTQTESYSFVKNIDFKLPTHQVITNLTVTGFFKEPKSGILFYSEMETKEKKVLSNTIPIKQLKVIVPRPHQAIFDSFVKGIYCAPTKPKEAKNLIVDYDRPVELGKMAAPDFEPCLLDDSAEEFARDLEEFLNSEDWYRDKKWKWKRSYLFYGIPGTGKTTMIQQVAKKFKKDVLYVPVDSLLNTHNCMKVLTAATKHGNCLILVEDLHNLEYFVKKSKEDIIKTPETIIADNSKEDNPHADLSPIFNFLDGALSFHGQVVCMTTNKPESLPDPMRRAGRIDLDLEVKPLSPEKINNNYNYFYNLPLNKLSISRKDPMTIADLTAILTNNKHTPERALELIERFDSSEGSRNRFRQT